MKNRSNYLKAFAKVSLILTALGGLFFVSGAMAAAATQGITLTSVAHNVGGTVSNIAKILSDVSLLAGIGFVMASFFKFHQHKLNPTQVPLSQGVTLLLIGAGLTLFPVLIPTAKRTVFGASASVSKLDGAGMKSLIGAAS